MRKSLTHFIEGTTKFVADFSGSLKKGVTIKSGTFRLDRDQEMIASQSVDGQMAAVEIKGGEPGCQYVLVFDGVATHGSKLHAEYWLNTKRNVKQEPAPVEPEISTETVTDE